MNILNTTTYTASHARENLYRLIKSASQGLKVYEIRLRGVEPVVLLNKAELESWLETLDVLNNPEEIKNIRKAKKQKKTYNHRQMLKEIGLDNKA